MGQDDSQIFVEDAAQGVSIDQQSEILRQIMAIAYIDGYFSPLEWELVNQLAQIWGIYEHEISQMLEEAQSFGQWQTGAGEEDEGLSVGARLLKGAESVLSRSLVKKLAELASDVIGRRIERLQRGILLSGPEYDDAIQQCVKIAGEVFKYADQALRLTFVTLRDLKNGIQQVIHEIKQNKIGQGNYQTAKGAADQLGQTRQKLSVEILRDLEVVRGALRAKQRTLNHFSIAFIGRTKAGKSTLHPAVTGEGWEAIHIDKQRIRK